MLEVRFLGPVEAVVDGKAKPIGSAIQRSVLATLALSPGSVVSSDRLIDVAWSGQPPDNSRATLHVYVSRLRKTIGAAHLVTRRPGYVLEFDSSDVAEFERLGGRREDAAALTEALALWRGDPYGELGDREPFRAEAYRLGELRSSVEDARAELLVAADPSMAVAELESLCEREPLREHRWVLLVRALAAAGRLAEGLRAVERARRSLAEVGLEPTPDLTGLIDELLAQPESIPTQTIADTAPSGTRVPIRVTPLVGRDDEIGLVGGLLGSRRMVTLVGSGGVGKTSLAQVLAGAAEFADGVYWCDLTSYDHPDSVVPAVARAVGAPLTGDIEDTLIAAVGDRHSLIVVDNCEQVIVEVAGLVERLVRSCPHLSVLATSREPLSIPPERVVPLSPLDPDEAAVDLFLERAEGAGTDTGSLDRGGVARVSRLLDGLPLAVEMAAARVRSLGVDELERRLTEGLGVLGRASRTADFRHRTLEAVVRWSADLLTERERIAMERCAVFAGSFTVGAAEDVVGCDPIDPGDVAALLGILVERSLLTVHHDGDGLRYSMLQTVRRVTAEWLHQRPDANEVGWRHADHYARLSDAIGENLIGPDEAGWAGRAVDELADLRAAIFTAAEEGWVDLSIRTCTGLYLLVYHRLRADIGGWAQRLFPAVEHTDHPRLPALGAMAALASVLRGDLAEAARWCRRARTTTQVADLVQVLEVELDIATYTGRFEQACDLGEQLIGASRERGSDKWEVMAMGDLALTRGYSGDTESGLALLSEMRSRLHELGSDTLAAWSDYVEGELILDSDPERAADVLERAVRVGQRTGATFVEGVAGVSAASVRARHGDIDLAKKSFVETIGRWLAAGDWIHQWVTLRNLAVLLDRMGDSEGAILVLSAVEDRERPSHGQEAVMLDGLTARLRQELGGAYQTLREEGRRLDDRQVVALALDRLGHPSVLATGH